MAKSLKGLKFVTGCDSGDHYMEDARGQSLGCVLEDIFPKELIGVASVMFFKAVADGDKIAVKTISAEQEKRAGLPAGALVKAGLRIASAIAGGLSVDGFGRDFAFRTIPRQVGLCAAQVAKLFAMAFKEIAR